MLKKKYFVQNKFFFQLGYGNVQTRFASKVMTPMLALNKIDCIVTGFELAYQELTFHAAFRQSGKVVSNETAVSLWKIKAKIHNY